MITKIDLKPKKKQRNMIKEIDPSINKPLKPVTYSLLSEHGINAAYPEKGIPGQTAEAKGTRINATLGQAFADERDEQQKLKPLILPSFLNANQKLNIDSIFPYASSFGFEALRQLWKEEIQRKNPSLESRISLPVVTCGIAHALTIINELFVNPEDNINLFGPYWGNYDLHFKDSTLNAIPIYNDNNTLNLTSFKESLNRSRQKKIILLNFPSNPTGYTPTIEEMDEIKRILFEVADQGNNIAVISDDAYFGLSYEPKRSKESPFAYLADLHENILAIKADGATKECFAWGLRIGFLTFARKGMTEEEANTLEKKVAGIVRGTISSPATQSQFTVLNGIKSEKFQEEVLANRSVLQKRYEKIKEILTSNPKYNTPFTPLPFNGGYFMCLKLNSIDPENVRTVLRQKYSTGVLSLNNTPFIRLAYSAVPIDDLPELFDNIYKTC